MHFGHKYVEIYQIYQFPKHHMLLKFIYNEANCMKIYLIKLVEVFLYILKKVST